MTSTDNQCIYCHRIYRKKENYEKHKQCCEFFYRARNRSNDDEMESYETLPTPREMFKLLKELAYRNTLLEEEVAKLRQNTSLKERNIINTTLQQIKPTLTATEWIKTFTIDFSDLECVFDYDLTQGMKRCIKRHVLAERAVENTVLPIAYFEQKHHNLYLYDHELPVDKSVVETPKWYIANQYYFDRMIAILSMKFLQYFMIWQRDYLENNHKEDEDTMKNKLIVYMMKVNNINSHVERRRNEIKRTLQESAK